MDGSVEKLLRAHHVHQLQPLGQVAAHLLHKLVNLLYDFIGIGPCGLRNHGRRSRMAVNLAVVSISLCSQFDGRDVIQTKHFATVQRLDHDVAKFLSRLIPSTILEGVLEGVFGVLAQRTGSCLQVLLVEHGSHVGRHKAILCHLLWIEPYTHGVVASHDIHIAHTAHTRKARLDVYLEIVVDKRLVIGIVGRVERDDFQHTVLPFLHGDSYLGHFSGQKSLSLTHTILGVDSSHVGVSPLLEVDSDVTRAGVGRCGSHVEHVLHAVDGFLQRDNDRFLHRLCIGTGISGRHHDGRWRDVGILFHRKPRQSDKPHQQDKHRHDT